MKKIMSLMLGLSLILGVATVAFGQDSTSTAAKKKGKKKKSTDSAAPSKLAPEVR
jgi:hypothetical protein